MTCGIYCYIDKKDDSIVYVGKDSHIDKNIRHKTHYQSCQYNKQPINRVLQNNPNRYTYQVLAWNVTDQDTLNALETQYITHLKPKFNFTNGGDGMLGYKHSEETKQKIRQSNKGRKHSEEAKQKMSINHTKCWLGRHHTKESKQKMSQTHKGKKFSIEHRKKLSQSKQGQNHPNYGKHHNSTIRTKMSKSQNTTGFFCVHKTKSERHKQGFVWRYNFYEDGKQKQISSKDFFKLRDKVLAKNLEWYIIDEEKAQKTIESLESLK